MTFNDARSFFSKHTISNKLSCKLSNNLALGLLAIAFIVPGTGHAFSQDDAQLIPVVTKTDDSFERVIKYLTPAMESQANYLILVNTAQPTIDQSLNRDFIRPQHLLVIERSANGALLPRTANGNVDVGTLQNLRPARYNIKDNAARWNAANTFALDTGISNSIRNIYREVPISSGLRNPNEQMIQTFTGVFRVNAEASLAKHTENPNAEMSNSLYVDHVYDEKKPRESGLAIHGVPNSWWDTFGLKRYSEGCIRTSVNFASELYTRVMKSPANFPAQMPMWDRKQVFPDAAAMAGASREFKVAPRAYIIFFDRFDGSENTPTL